VREVLTAVVLQKERWVKQVKIGFDTEIRRNIFGPEEISRVK
jgi:hypothetical protein